MRSTFALAATLALAAPGRAADDLTPLFPPDTVVAAQIDVKAVLASPFGKKVLADGPLPAARKLYVALTNDPNPPGPADAKPFAAVAAKVERVTVLTVRLVGNQSFLGFEEHSTVILLEGTGTEAEYAKALEGYARATGDKAAGRTVMAAANEKLFGAPVRDGLYAISDRRGRLLEVFDRADDLATGRKLRKTSPVTAAALKRLEPAQVRLAGAAPWDASLALTFGDDIDLRAEGAADDFLFTEFARAVEDFAKGELLFNKFWAAAKVAEKTDKGRRVVTAKLPSKLLAELYAQQK